MWLELTYGNYGLIIDCIKLISLSSETLRPRLFFSIKLTKSVVFSHCLSKFSNKSS